LLVRTVICNRCGSVVKKPHPDRITVARHRFEEYTDYFGKPHRKSVYKNDKPIHFCDECNEAFRRFLVQELVDIEDNFDEECK